MRMMTWLLWAKSGLRIGLVMILLTGPPSLEGAGSLIWSYRFFVAIARAAVNEDVCAGVALHPTV